MILTGLWLCDSVNHVALSVAPHPALCNACANFASFRQKVSGHIMIWPVLFVVCMFIAANNSDTESWDLYSYIGLLCLRGWVQHFEEYIIYHFSVCQTIRCSDGNESLGFPLRPLWVHCNFFLCVTKLKAEPTTMFTQSFALIRVMATEFWPFKISCSAPYWCNDMSDWPTNLMGSSLAQSPAFLQVSWELAQ